MIGKADHIVNAKGTDVNGTFREFLERTSTREWFGETSFRIRFAARWFYIRWHGRILAGWSKLANILLRPYVAPVFVAAFFGVLVFSGCSDNVAGGGSTETGNTIAGVVAVDAGNVHVSGFGTENLRVRLLKVNHAPTRTPEGYRVIPLAEAKVGEDGTFNLHPVSSGLYNLEVVDTLNHLSVLFDSIAYTDTSRDFETGTLSLQYSAVVSGSFPRSLVASEVGAVYIPGTSSFVTIEDIQQIYWLPDTPPGLHGVRIRSTQTTDGACEDCVNPADFELSDEIEILPGDTVQILGGMDVSSTD